VSRADPERDRLKDLATTTISVAEACAVSGFTPGWIRRLLIEGKLEGIKIGRDWRLTEASLRKYLDKDRRPGPKTE
jgi:excisionase family DNA binding protein